MTVMPRSMRLARGAHIYQSVVSEPAIQRPLEVSPALRLQVREERRPEQLSRRDLAWMAVGLGFTMLVSLILGYRRIFWEDEMLGWMLLRDPSWSHMVWAWKHGADGGGFAFYLTGRLWFALFGASEIAFRMYSALCFGLAFCVLWAALRRFYSTRIVAFAMFNTWFFSPPIVTHMAEGRFYGLLMLSVASAVWLLVKVDEKPRPPAYLYGLMVLCHALVTTSHLLGIIYSATLFFALLALDRMRGRFRPLLYLSVAASWLLLIPERAAIRASAQVGKPHFWTTPPNVSRFIGAYTAYSTEVAFVLLLLGVALFLSLRQSQAGWWATLKRATVVRRPAYVVAAALLCVPLEILAEGLVGPSLFINRYMIPVAIAQSFITAEAVRLIDWRRLLGRFRPESRWARRSLALCFVAAILFWDFGHLSNALMVQPNYTDELSSRLPTGVPVLCEDAWVFTELIGRQHASGVHYIYLLDWPQSISTSAPRLEVTQFHLMENWRNVGYFSGSIQYRDDFLRDNPRFLILHQEALLPPMESPTIGNPLLRRFMKDPGYQVLPYGAKGPQGLQDTWLVCRGSCTP